MSITKLLDNLKKEDDFVFNTENFIKLIDDSILSNRERRPLAQRTEFIISNISDGERILYFFMRGEKQEEIDAITQRKFDTGNDMHERFYRYFKKAGILLEEEKVVHKNSPPISGRLDAILNIFDHKFVVDLKSINANGFRNIKRLNTGKPEHISQLQVYMDIENIPQGLLIYECKDNSEIFPVFLRFDKELVDGLYDKLFSVMEYLRIGKIPTRCFGCAAIHPYNCNYRSVCNKISEGIETDERQNN